MAYPIFRYLCKKRHLGEGRGPVAKVETTEHDARKLPFRDWAPASAGVGLRLLAAIAFTAATPAHATPDLAAYARARAADGDGRPRIAAIGYTQALAAQPDSVVIAQRAYREALDAGDLTLLVRAMQVLDKADKAPADAALLRLALAIRDDDVAARTAALASIKDGPFDFVRPTLNAWIAFDAGAPIPPLERVAGNPLATRFNAENSALLLIARGKVEDGVLALQALIGVDPASLDLRISAAQLLAAQNRPAIATSLLRGDDRLLTGLAARLGDGVKPSAGFGASRLFVRLAADLAQGDPTPLSIALARAALILEPGNDRVRLLLAAALSRAGAADAALAAAAEITPTSPFHAAAQDARVRILARAGDAPRTLAAAQALSDAPGGDSDDAARLANLLMTADRFDDAARAYRLAIARACKTAPWSLYLQLGAALDRGGNWPAARKALDRALALGPDEPLALNYLGYAQIERGEDVAAARVMLERASRLAPDNVSITDSLAWAYFRGGDAARALPLLERASMADPANGEIAEHLGDAYWSIGRRYEARYAWRAAAVVADTGDTARLAAKIARGPRP